MQKIGMPSEKINFYDFSDKNRVNSRLTPFTEKPSVSAEKEVGKKKGICAHELFSMFTADIIKEDTLFTR
jgi:hypothetical protein